MYIVYLRYIQCLNQSIRCGRQTDHDGECIEKEEKELWAFHNLKPRYRYYADQPQRAGAGAVSNYFVTFAHCCDRIHETERQMITSTERLANTFAERRYRRKLKFSAVDQKLFNQVIEQLVSALDKLHQQQ